ncbi:MAG TPA: hypothetical protein VFQ91_25105 [Bryobacteraceae bacterium]|nr:hypothetical protein [Bryobacteraceae bacterium]
MTLDKLANWTIVVSMPFLVALVGYNLTRNPTSDRNREIESKIKNAKLTLVGEKDGDEAIGIFLSPECRFCTESAPTYKKFLAAAQNGKMRVVGIFQEPESAARAYTGGLGYELHRYVSPDSVGMTERVPTPTMVLVNRKGEVKRMWIGRPTPAVEKEVLDIVAGQGNRG